MRLIDIEPCEKLGHAMVLYATEGGMLIQIRSSDMPTIDAVPVVRCKDCKHWLNEDGLDDHVCLKIYSDGVVSAYAWQHREPDDFCSYGERKEDGDALSE